MSSIFTTNSQADRLQGLQQRVAVRPDGLGARRAEKSAPTAAGSSNTGFLKARADARALERARANDAARSSAIENSRDAASQRARDVSERAANTSASARANASANASANISASANTSANASASASERPTYDRSPIGAKAPGTVNGQNRPDNIPGTLEDKPRGGDGSSSRGGGTQHIEKAVALSGNARSDENSLEPAKTTQPGGSEGGLLNAYLDQNGTDKKVNISPRKVAGAYETVAADPGNEDAAPTSDKGSGELPKLVNARAGAYISESSGGGAQAVVDGQAAGAGGLAEGAGKELAGIIKGEAGEVGGVNTGVLEDTVEAGLREKSGVVDDGGKRSQEAGKDAGAAAAGSATVLKAAYAEARIEEKGVKKKGAGEEQVTQKTSDMSSKKTAPQRIVPPGGEQVSVPTEEPALEQGEGAGSAELIEVARGKEQGGLPGFTKDNGAGRSKPDTAAMKNDGKAEAVVQVKDTNTGVEAAKKTAAAPKTFGNFGKLQEGVFSALDRGIRLSLANGRQDAKLTLRPESLGELRIKLSIGEDGRVHSKIMVDNVTVKSILDNDAARLKGMFSEQGLDLESFSVEVGSGWSGKSARGGGSGFDLNGRGAQRAYSDAAGGGALELDTSVMAGGVYGSLGGGLDLFA